MLATVTAGQVAGVALLVLIVLILIVGTFSMWRR